MSGAAPLELNISSSEKFLRFCNKCDNSDAELTLGPLLLEKDSHHRLEAFSTARFEKFCAYFGCLSNSQLFQDLLPLYFLGLKPGIFFEAGMADGVALSNTYMLEKLFDWQGIGVEPLPEFFSQAIKTRTGTHMFNCALVHDDSTQIVTLRTGGLLSSLDKAMPDDPHAEMRNSFGEISVPARSFMSIAREANLQHIDFLSLDVEGYELAILESIDFALVKILIIAVEHNHTPEKALIHDFLAHREYTRVFEDVSSHDDFYVHNSVHPFEWNTGNLYAIKSHPHPFKSRALC